MLVLNHYLNTQCYVLVQSKALVASQRSVLTSNYPLACLSLPFAPAYLQSHTKTGSKLLFLIYEQQESDPCPPAAACWSCQRDSLVSFFPLLLPPRSPSLIPAIGNDAGVPSTRQTSSRVLCAMSQTTVFLSVRASLALSVCLKVWCPHVASSIHNTARDVLSSSAKSHSLRKILNKIYLSSSSITPIRHDLPK